MRTSALPMMPSLVFMSGASTPSLTPASLGTRSAGLVVLDCLADLGCCGAALQPLKHHPSYPAHAQLFVDEFSCIGCRNCANVCPRSFAIEEDYGRARVQQQGTDSEAKLQEAVRLDKQLSAVAGL